MPLLYWFVRMIDGGVDPRYAARRLARMASWRTSAWPIRAPYAWPWIPPRPTSGWSSPEGELALAEPVVYLAVAPKSNAVYAAFNAARAFVKGDRTRPVPLRLRNAPTSLMKTLDYGKGYRYAHDEAGGFAAGERYWFGTTSSRRASTSRSTGAWKFASASAWRSCVLLNEAAGEPE